MESDGHGTLDINQIFVDGGVSMNSILMQTQSEFLNKNVVTKKEKELTAIGAAIASGLKVGVWDSLDDVSDIIQVENIYTPKLDADIRDENERKWKLAVQKSLDMTIV